MPGHRFSSSFLDIWIYWCKSLLLILIAGHLDLVEQVVGLNAVAEIHTEDLFLYMPHQRNLREGEGKEAEPEGKKKLHGCTLGSHRRL